MTQLLTNASTLVQMLTCRTQYLPMWLNPFRTKSSKNQSLGSPPSLLSRLIRKGWTQMRYRTNNSACSIAQAEKLPLSGMSTVTQSNTRPSWHSERRTQILRKTVTKRAGLRRQHRSFTTSASCAWKSSIRSYTTSICTVKTR